MPMPTTTRLLPPSPAITPPTTPSARPASVSFCLENLFASGTTNAAAIAIGTAPRMDRMDMYQSAPSTSEQKYAIEPFFTAPAHWNSR